MRDRPCLHLCNRPGCGPTICLGRRSYPDSDPRAWVGRGYANVPGKPFGWAFNMERRALREHLERKGRYSAQELFFAVTRLQERIHRDKPTYRQRQEAWKARHATRAPAPTFTEEELRHLVDLFEGANDPLTAAIYEKARVILSR